MYPSLKDKVAVITGAGGEVGKTTVKRLWKEGCKVILLGRTRQKLLNVIHEIGDDKNLTVLQTDITKETDILSSIDQIISIYGKIDILINNAGIINDPSPFHLMHNEKIMELLNINLIGTFKITKAIIPIMMRSLSGTIINISSILGQRAISDVPLSIYGVTKAGIIMFTKSIATEYGGSGIRCNCIAPSTIRGPFIEPYLKDENARKTLYSAFPLNKIGEPEDISSAIAFLCSDEAKWITGTIINIDGGMSAKQ